MSVFCVISHIDFVTSQNNEFLISQNKKLFYTTEVISKIYKNILCNKNHNDFAISQI